MTDNVRNANQRLKILYLLKILTEETDELHPLTMREIIVRLEHYGISAERRALYTDIEALKSFGIDIISTKGNATGYFVVSRDFELPELKLLADAVSSSRFLTERKSASLIKKIGQLASVHEAKQIQRHIYVTNRIKSMNESIYRSVDVINRAIDEGKQIRFRYFDFTVEKVKQYREGGRTCHPYALAWENENYYLIGYNDNHNDISNFRVDRMEQVEILNAPIRKKPEGFDVAEYVNSTFSMFSGQDRSVKLRFGNEFINAVIDRFGKDVHVTIEDNGHFTVKVNVKPTPTFFSWLTQFEGKASVVEPSDVKEQYIKQLRQVLQAAEE